MDTATYVLARLETCAYSRGVATPGENLKRLLAVRKISASELGRMVGVPPQRVNDWINRYGTIELDTALKVAVALRVGVDDLLVGVNESYDAVRRDLLGPTSTGELTSKEEPLDTTGSPHAETRILQDRISTARDQLEAVNLHLKRIVDGLHDRAEPQRIEPPETGTRGVRRRGRR